MIPLVLDLHGRTILVAGGGDGGARLARRFAAEAQVVVLAPEAPSLLDGLPTLHIEGSPDGPDLPALLREALLVVPAADDPRVNARVAEMARASGCFVLPPPGSNDGEATARTMGTVERGSLVVGVAETGGDAVLQEHVRGLLDRDLGPELALLPNLLARVRARVDPAGDGLGDELVRAVLWDEGVWDRLRAEDVDGALARVEALEGVDL